MSPDPHSARITAAAAAAIFQIVADTVAGTYEVQAADPVARAVTTVPRWYRQDGSSDYLEDDTFPPT